MIEGGLEMTTEKLKTKTKNITTEINQVRAPMKNGGTKAIKTAKKKTLKLPVIIKPGEIGYFVAEIPILPGCLSQGKTREEALVNIKDAAELYLSGESLPVILKQYILTEVEVSI
jgi:predicted RNase H-like HicB family nuclease